jgi:hypothetical protein
LQPAGSAFLQPVWSFLSGVASLREIGALGSIGLRSFVIAMGLEDAMPFKLLVYVAFAVGLALWLWLSLFGDR